MRLSPAVLAGRTRSRRIEADVERIQHGAKRGHRVVRFEQRRHVGRHDGHGIAARNAAAASADAKRRQRAWNSR